jgi:hypothetical protein
VIHTLATSIRCQPRPCVASGYVERVGNVYWLTEKTNRPSVQNVVAKNVNLIIAAAKELARTKVAKMNK